jgi:hypothetical protein
MSGVAAGYSVLLTCLLAMLSVSGGNCFWVLFVLFIELVFSRTLMYLETTHFNMTVIV